MISSLSDCSYGLQYEESLSELETRGSTASTAKHYRSWGGEHEEVAN